jgi:amino acid transporter
MSNKAFKLRDVILSCICVTFTIEACATAAAIGNSSVFWWIFLLVTFLLPYGMVVSELGTAYAEGGGVYEWVRDSMGRGWASREGWYYWVNYFTWLASVALLFPATIESMMGSDMPEWVEVLIEVVFIWIVMYISNRDIGDLSHVMNFGAIVNVVLAFGVGALGVWYGLRYGFANPLTPESMLPDFSDPGSLSFLSVIIYNYLGCEVIATFVEAMDDPDRTMPKAIISSGLVIAAIYLVISLGISTAIPSDEINLDTGILDAVAIMAGHGGPIYNVTCILFLISLTCNMVSWSHGVGSVTTHASLEGSLPRAFAGRSDDPDDHVSSYIVTGVATSLLVMLGPLCESLGIGFFYVVLSLDIVFTLAAYVPLFPAFLILRTKDPDHPRPYRVPGGKVLNVAMCVIPVIELLYSIALSIIPFGTAPSETAKIPLLVGTILTCIIGEVVCWRSRRNYDRRVAAGKRS